MQKCIKQKINTDNKYHNPEVTTINSFPPVYAYMYIIYLFI